MLQSAMEQHAFTVWESRWVEKMKEMDRALWKEEAHIQWLEREGTYLSIPKTLQQLYISFVRLHLDYAAPVWDFQLQKDMDKLEKKQTFALWMCIKYWLAGYDDLLSSFNIPFLKNRCLCLKSLASELSTCWFCGQYQLLRADHFLLIFFWSKHIKSITSKARQLVDLLFRQFYKHARLSTNFILQLCGRIPRVWDPYLVTDCESIQKFANLQAGCA